MSFVLSLIVDARAARLEQATIDQSRQLCAELGISCGPWRWLDSGVAGECDLESQSGQLLARLRAELAALPIDVNVIAGQNRRKGVFVCDMDATAIQGETLDDLSAFTGFKREIDELTRQSVEGEMGFVQSLLRRVELMRGLEIDAFERTYATVRPSPGIRTLVATMRANGALTALVSGGFRFFTSRVREEIGFDVDIANELEIAEGRLTGKLLAPIVDPAAKARAVSDLTRQRGMEPSAAIAAGDGYNDLPMLKHAGIGVVYRGKAKLRSAIACQVNHADLTALLFLQGYRRDEFKIAAT